MEAKTESIRYEVNPFLESMVIPKKGRAIKLSKLGRDDNVLINHSTGEVLGTHVTTYKKVDSEQFVKIFTANIALTFDLKAAGIKAFNVLIWAMSEKGISKDLVPLDKLVLEQFLKTHSLKLSQPTFWRGLAELEKSQIIAKHLRQGWYFINPNFVFNGDRIAFTTVIEKAKPADDLKTIDMFENL
jgi:hypothetical protein